MWSVGVLSYVLLSGLSPFLGEDNQVSHIDIKITEGMSLNSTHLAEHLCMYVRRGLNLLALNLSQFVSISHRSNIGAKCKDVSSTIYVCMFDVGNNVIL